MGKYHKVETNSNLNINFSIILKQNNAKKIIKCKKNLDMIIKYKKKNVIKIIVFK